MKDTLLHLHKTPECQNGRALLEESLRVPHAAPFFHQRKAGQTDHP